MPQTTTKPTTRLELITSDAALITERCDLIPGNAQLAEENIYPDDNGDIELAWEGGTEVIWDAQEAEYKYGEATFLDDKRRIHLAGDLLVAEITQDEDGNERVTTRPYTGGIEPTLPAEAVAQLTPAGQADRALKYASWIMASIEENARGQLTTQALERIHARAHEHAKREGVHETLERILASLGA